MSLEHNRELNMGKNYLKLIFFIFMANFSHFTPAEQIEHELRIGFMPYITAVELVQKYTPLAEYLQQELGKPVKIVVTKDYPSLTDAVDQEAFEIIFFGGFSYIKAVEQHGKLRLIARWELQHKPYFHAVIFVPTTSPIKSLHDLIGKSFAFGSKSSTLSSVVPRYMLQQAGIELAQFATYDYLTNHEDVILGVLLGTYHAGAVAEEIFHQYQKQYSIKDLALSQPLSTHVFAVAPHVSADLYLAIKQAFLELKQHPQAKDIMGSISADLTAFVTVQDSDYDLHREIDNNLVD
jgi:phosphonate transport system substrate-binding protein